MRTDGQIYVRTDRRIDRHNRANIRNLAIVPKITNTCIVIRGITIINNFIQHVELIMNTEVNLVYFSTLYSHLEGQTEE